MDVNFETPDYEKNYFNNDSFLFLIIIMDNIMNWRHSVKDKFLEKLESDETASSHLMKIQPRKMFQKLMQIYYVLFKIVVYKTFQDSYWDEYWS